MKPALTFGETVKKLREQKQLPMREVAKALKIDTSMLGKIEKNYRRPNKQLIVKFSQYFNVSNKELMIAFISDTIVYQVMSEEDFASDVLKVVVRKVKYLKTQKNKR